jgi:hypothetical protein
MQNAKCKMQNGELQYPMGRFHTSIVLCRLGVSAKPQAASGNENRALLGRLQDGAAEQGLCAG